MMLRMDGSQSDEKRRMRRSALAQQLRQLGDIGGDAPSFVAGQQLARRAPPRFILAIDKGV